MNILVLSCGTRNKIIQYFRETLHKCGGKIYATDCSEMAPALYDADGYFLDKRLGEDGYLDGIFDYCKKKKINGILSLIDPELSILAFNEHKFRKIGTTVIGSNYDLCEMSLDKYRMFQWLEKHDYKTAKSWLNRKDFFKSVDGGRISFPVFVKPVRGSASISISKAYDIETVDFLCNHEDGLIIQQYLDGQEIGADVYIDMISGEVVSIFTKKKIKMRAGETDKAESFKSPKLFSFIEKFVKEAGYQGEIDIDIFEIDGEYYISEVNPRFGGGYPHAYECGCDHMRMIVNNLKGIKNRRVVGNYDEGVFLMKYNEVKTIRGIRLS